MTETQVQEQTVNTAETADANVPTTPVFEEADGMSQDQAINVLIQAAQVAQQTGRLSVRDSVLLARSIDVLRPGTI